MGQPVITKLEAAKQSIGLLGQWITQPFTSTSGWDKRISFSDVFTPFEASSPTRAVQVVANPYYIPPQRSTITNIPTIYDKPTATGAEIRQETMIRTQIQNLDVARYIGLPPNLVGVRLGEDVSKIYQGKIDTGELTLDEAKVLAQSEYETKMGKLGGIYQNQPQLVDTLGERSFSSKEFTQGLGTAALTIGSIVSPPIATLAGMYTFTKFAGMSTNPNFSTKERLIYGGQAIVGLGITYLGGRQSVINFERGLARSEIMEVLGRNTKIFQPTFETRFTSKFVDVGITKLSTGRVGIASAKTELGMIGVTGKTGSSFVFGQSGIVKSVGELSFKPTYFGDKWMSVQVFSQGGKGFMLPSQVAGKGFSISQLTSNINVGSTTFYNKFSPKVWENIGSNWKVLPSETGKYYFGTSTRLKDNLFLTKTFDLKAFGVSTRTGSWGAITGDLKSRGFVRTREIPKVVFDTKAGGMSYSQGGGLSNQIRGLSFSMEKTGLTPTSKLIPPTTTFSPQVSISTKIPNPSGVLVTSSSLLQEKRTSQVFSPNYNLKLRGETTIPTTSVQLPASSQEFRTTQPPLTSQIQIPTTRPTIPNIPAPPSISPIGLGGGIPPFFFPKINLPDETMGSRGFKPRRKLKYTPSFSALIFGIKGKQPRGLETGARVRPIPKGFKWSFGESSLKFGGFTISPSGSAFKFPKMSFNNKRMKVPKMRLPKI